MEQFVSLVFIVLLLERKINYGVVYELIIMPHTASEITYPVQVWSVTDFRNCKKIRDAKRNIIHECHR